MEGMKVYQQLKRTFSGKKVHKHSGKVNNSMSPMMLRRDEVSDEPQSESQLTHSDSLASSSKDNEADRPRRNMEQAHGRSLRRQARQPKLREAFDDTKRQGIYVDKCGNDQIVQHESESELQPLLRQRRKESDLELQGLVNDIDDFSVSSTEREGLAMSIIPVSWDNGKPKLANGDSEEKGTTEKSNESKSDQLEEYGYILVGLDPFLAPVEPSTAVSVDDVWVAIARESDEDHEESPILSSVASSFTMPVGCSSPIEGQASPVSRDRKVREVWRSFSDEEEFPPAGVSLLREKKLEKSQKKPRLRIKIPSLSRHYEHFTDEER